METLYKGYRPTIGIEVHAELKTKTKMFCSSKNEPHASVPNTHICPVCMGHPGTHPVINKEAVKHVVRVGLAVGGEVADYTEFDRKNYFYPDIPKGYQISQYLYPLIKGGVLADVQLTRIHLEEDTARSQHDQGEGSLVDYNRAGVPLMELVTEPVIHDAKTAGDFARELQLLLRTIGASTANMEKGEMRVEANISVSKTETFGTKVEVKNINSFKAVEAAIEYEVRRQVELIERGEKVIQETRGWDENKAKTFSQRIKESADDYRYFPDPDLPKLKLSVSSDVSLSSLAETMPVLPQIKRAKYTELGLSREQVETIVGNLEYDVFFQECISKSNTDSVVKLIANYLTSDLIPHLSIEQPIAAASSKHFVDLMVMISEDAITSRVAKDILHSVVFGHVDPRALAEEKGLIKNNSTEAINAIVSEIVSANPTVVAEYLNGKEPALQFLVGQGMRLSKGSANPEILRDLLQKQIKGS
jgi:aspartyl-tRNA(Asn)/glutamyl-tRNA(Gln) amidotransferase subunit B